MTLSMMLSLSMLWARAFLKASVRNHPSLTGSTKGASFLGFLPAFMLRARKVVPKFGPLLYRVKFLAVSCGFRIGKCSPVTFSMSVSPAWNFSSEVARLGTTR